MYFAALPELTDTDRLTPLVPIEMILWLLFCQPTYLSSESSKHGLVI